MHPVPDDLDFGSLVGEQLNQVCVGPFDLQLKFGGRSPERGWTISCFGRVEHHRDGDVTLVFHNSLKAPSQALSVVGQTVIGWGLRRPDTVVISFGDGSSLWLVAQVSGTRISGRHHRREPRGTGRRRPFALETTRL